MPVDILLPAPTDHAGGSAGERPDDAHPQPLGPEDDLLQVGDHALPVLRIIVQGVGIVAEGGNLQAFGCALTPDLIDARLAQHPDIEVRDASILAVLAEPPAGQQATSIEPKPLPDRKSSTCAKLRRGNATLMTPIFMPLPSFAG